MTIAQVAVLGALALALFAAAALAVGRTIDKLVDVRARRRRRREPPIWRPDPSRVRKIQQALERRASKADASGPDLT